MIGTDSLESRPVYIIEVRPKREDKYLFEGRIWVDAEDFALVRAEGKPAKNPSFWTHSVNFVQMYHKSGNLLVSALHGKRDRCPHLWKDRGHHQLLRVSTEIGCWVVSIG